MSCQPPMPLPPIMLIGQRPRASGTGPVPAPPRPSPRGRPRRPARRSGRGAGGGGPPGPPDRAARTARSALSRRATSSRSRRSRPSAVSATNVERRSSGSGRRATSPAASTPSTRSVTVRGTTESRSAMVAIRNGPSARRRTTRACARERPSGASASLVPRWRRPDDLAQKVGDLERRLEIVRGACRRRFRVRDGHLQRIPHNEESSRRGRAPGLESPAAPMTPTFPARPTGSSPGSRLSRCAIRDGPSWHRARRHRRAARCRSRDTPWHARGRPGMLPP